MRSWASTEFPRRNLLSYVAGEDGAEPAYAVADAYEPPHELSLPLDVADRVLKGAQGSVARPSGRDLLLRPRHRRGRPGEHPRTVRRGLRAVVVVDVDTWYVGVKRYAVGERHPAHQDLHAGAAGRKLARVVQLSEPGDCGDLVMSFAHHRVPMPRARGTLVAFLGWTVHEVTPVTAGVWWSL